MGDRLEQVKELHSVTRVQFNYHHTSLLCVECNKPWPRPSYLLVTGEPDAS